MTAANVTQNDGQRHAGRVLHAIVANDARTQESLTATTGLTPDQVGIAVEWLAHYEYVTNGLEPYTVSSLGASWLQELRCTRSWILQVLELIESHPGEAGTWYARQLGWTDGEYRGRWQRLRERELVERSGSGSASRWQVAALGHTILSRDREDPAEDSAAPTTGPEDGFRAPEHSGDECRAAVARWLAPAGAQWTDARTLTAWMVDDAGWTQTGAQHDIRECVRIGIIELRQCGGRRWYRAPGSPDLHATLTSIVETQQALQRELEAHREQLLS